MTNLNKRKVVLNLACIAIVAILVLAIGAPNEPLHYPHLKSNNLVVINPDTGAPEYTRKDIQNEQIGHYVLSGPNNSPNVFYNVETNESTFNYYTDAYPTTPLIDGADEETIWPLGYGGLLYDSDSHTIVDGLGVIDGRINGSYRYLDRTSPGSSLDWREELRALRDEHQRGLLHNGPAYVYTPFLSRSDIGWPSLKRSIDARGSSGYQKDDAEVFVHYPELTTTLGQALAGWGLPTRLEFNLPWWGVTRPGAAAALADYHGRDPRTAEYSNAVNGSITTIAVGTSVLPIAAVFQGGAAGRLAAREAITDLTSEVLGATGIDPTGGLLSNFTGNISMTGWGQRFKFKGDRRTPKQIIQAKGYFNLGRHLEEDISIVYYENYPEDLLNAIVYNQRLAIYLTDDATVAARYALRNDVDEFTTGRLPLIASKPKKDSIEGTVGIVDTENIRTVDAGAILPHHVNAQFEHLARNADLEDIVGWIPVEGNTLRQAGLIGGSVIEGTSGAFVPNTAWHGIDYAKFVREGNLKGAAKWAPVAAISNGILQAYQAHKSGAGEQSGASGENSVLSNTAPTPISAHVFTTQSQNRGRLLFHTQGKQVQACE